MKKLYVLVRDSLTPSQKAVQCSHAVAEHVLNHPDDWRNEILVLLDVHDFDYALYLTENSLRSVFYEPDLDQITAIATTQHLRFFDRLGLV